MSEEESIYDRFANMANSMPFLTSNKIPGKDPDLAMRLRELADSLNDLADEYDDRYECPLPVAPDPKPESGLTITFGIAYPSDIPKDVIGIDEAGNWVTRDDIEPKDEA